MAEEKRFLIGNGDNLRETIPRPPISPTKDHPYTLDYAKQRLIPKLQQTVDNFMSLDQAACPNNEAIALLTLHPAYIAKSYYPSQLIRGLGFRALGSRSRKVVPEKVTAKTSPSEVETVELYVSGIRQDFQNWACTLNTWTTRHPPANELNKIEDLRPLTSQLRLKPIPTDDPEPLLEIVLHASYNDGYVIQGFKEYLHKLGLKVDLDKQFIVKGLFFLPLRVPQELIERLAQFSFLRLARPMPRLRSFPTVFPTRQAGSTFSCKLPSKEALNPTVRAAIFDGGLPKNNSLDQWATHHETSNLHEPHTSLQAHGLAVTSALLFGPIEKGKELSRPPGIVDHYRVLDKKTGANDYDKLYDVLNRIDAVLRNNDYGFVNLSIGPNLPIEDNDVHAWTAVLDEYLADGNTLATIAVGNDGELDRESGNARVQVPADCVNGLAVGACDNQVSPWLRAPYSSIGPGRSPGIVKPDCVSFGGTENKPFYVLSAQKPISAVGTFGTSFASPLVLRTAMAVRAHMGEQLNPLALKALLINRTEANDEHISEIGWGKIPSDIDALLTCNKGEVRIVYQGTLRPGSYVRLSVPVPKAPIRGMIRITATFCFASRIDPQDSVSYTRSGLDIAFRPDNTKFNNPEQINPNSKPFFSTKKYATESELRRDFHKWETTLHANKNMRGSSLKEPFFDVHHGARERGHLVTSAVADDIPYALVINIEASRVPNIYDEVLIRYPNRLRALKPVIEVPIRAIDVQAKGVSGL